MAYDENVARRLRSVLVDLPDISEVKMMGGALFSDRRKHDRRNPH